MASFFSSILPPQWMLVHRIQIWEVYINYQIEHDMELEIAIKWYFQVCLSIVKFLTQGFPF